MAKKKNGNGMWIAGAVLGAVAGAAYAMWKTPMSGQELRGKLSTGPVDQHDEMPTNTVRTPTVGDKILNTIEQTLAPIVGVELGKTANGSSNGTVTEPIRVVEPSPVPSTAPAPAQAPEPAAEFKAARPDHADTVVEQQDSGVDSARAQRFAWGAPTPEAGIDPVPADPVIRDVATAPDPTPEPVASTVGADTPTTFGTDTIRAQRFQWGDPTPESAAEPVVEEENTPVDAEETGSSKNAVAEAAQRPQERPLEAATSAASAPGTNLRPFPKLGGLEDS